MRHLLLVRHGQSEWNREGRIQGQSGPGLTDVGRRQVRRTVAWLAEVVPGAPVVSSDLTRCVETAEPIAAALGVEPALEEDLRERDLGAWTGRLHEEVREDDPQRFSRWRAGEDVVPEVGGESSSRLTGRVVAVLERLLARLPEDGVVVVVTHAGPVWHGTHGLLGLTPGVLSGVANASATEVTADGEGRRLTAWNQTTHLPVELSPRWGPTGTRPGPPADGA